MQRKKKPLWSNLDGEDPTKKYFWVGSYLKGGALQHPVKQVPCNLKANILVFAPQQDPFDPLTNQSLAQADMLLDPKRLNLGLDKEAKVLEVGHLDESISLELVRDSFLLIRTSIFL